MTASGLKRLALPLVALLLAGCSTTTPVRTVSPVITGGYHGAVHGGQQPITGATIQIYAVGTTGDGSTAATVLATPLTTDANGFFDLTNKITCPTPTSLLYLVATGGNPGLPPPANNNRISLITALGACNNPSNVQFINVNEVTTVAAVFALSPYMTSLTAIGSDTTDAADLATAFTTAWQLADITSGNSPGANIPNGTTIPTPLINTLANLLSACINSAGGTAGDSSPCGQIFTLLTPAGGTAPTDATTALLNLAKNPALNTGALYNLTFPLSPFQPTLGEQPANFAVYPTVPSNFTVTPGSLSFGSIFVGGTTATQTVTVANNTARIIDITTTLAGPDSSDFTLVPDPNQYQGTSCYSPIPASSSCTYLLAFHPSAAGLRHGYLVVKNSSVNPYRIVALTGTGTPGTAGSISISPSSLDFSLVNTPQTLTLTNAGTSTLNISGITFNQQFIQNQLPRFYQTNNCGTSLPAQSICTINVSVHNIDTSTASAILTVADDATTGPQTVTTSFAPGAGFVSGFPDTLYFGPTSAIATSSYVLRPYSGGNGTGIGFAGANASDFSAIALAGCSAGAPSDPCLLQVTFQPRGPGPRNALGTVYNTGNVILTGTGVGSGPYFQVRSDSYLPAPDSILYLGSQLGSSYTAALDVRYTGSTKNSLNAPVFNAPAGHAAEFTSTNNCPPSTDTCTLNITYTPTTAPESFIGTIVVSDSSNIAQQTIPFAANASKQYVSATPGGLDFPNTLAGTQSSPLSLTVSAYNNDPIKAAITSGSYVITSGSTCAATPCTISVAFAPSAASSAGNSYGTLTITDPLLLTSGKQLIQLSGTVTTQTSATLSPGALNFALRSVNTTSIPQYVTLTNTGTAHALHIGSVSLTGANPGDYVLTNNCSSTLSINSNCSVGISFAPTATGTRTATLSIVSDSTSSPNTVTLSGTAQ